MKIKQTIMTMVVAVSVMAGSMMYIQPVYADEKTKAQIEYEEKRAAEVASGCGGAATSIIKCKEGAGSTTTDNGVWGLLMLVLNIMTAGIGIAAVGGIAYGSALYASSSDKPEQAKQGVTYIKNVVIGLVAYGLMYILLNFLIPGGIFT